MMHSAKKSLIGRKGVIYAKVGHGALFLILLFVIHTELKMFYFAFLYCITILLIQEWPHMTTHSNQCQIHSRSRIWYGFHIFETFELYTCKIPQCRTYLLYYRSI